MNCIVSGRLVVQLSRWATWPCRHAFGKIAVQGRGSGVERPFSYVLHFDRIALDRGRAYAAPPRIENVENEIPSADWRSPWLELLHRLHGCGHFSGDQHVTIHTIEEDSGALKRAVLNFARQRADILASLSHRHLKALVAAGPPPGLLDRKTRNAYRRLEASILDETDLPPGDGGAADLQDVLRMVLALSGAVREGAGKDGASRRLISASAALIPEIIQAMDVPMNKEGAMSEKAKNIKRMQSGGGTRPMKKHAVGDDSARV